MDIKRSGNTGPNEEATFQDVNIVLRKRGAKTKLKFGVVLKASGIVIPLSFTKAIMWSLNLDVLTSTTFTAPFLGGVLLILGFLLYSTVTDYKEAEKIPAEMAALIKSLYKDIRIACINHDHMMSLIQQHVKELIDAIISNLRENVWRQKEVNRVIDELDNDVGTLVKQGIGLQFIPKLRGTLTDIEKISNRIETIKETTFIPAAHGLAESGAIMAVSILLFTRLNSIVEGFVFACISLLVISITLFIRDMEDPFDVFKSYVYVDLEHLYKLEQYLGNK